MLNIAIVDDHAVFRDGLRALAERGGMQVIAEGEDGRDAIEIADSPTPPDVIVLDVQLRAMNGLIATREIVGRGARTSILVLTAHSGAHQISRALAVGARGYALKTQPSLVVVDAIRVVARGERYLPPEVSGSVIDEMLRAARRRGGDGSDSPTVKLSTREQEIFDLLVRGMSNDGIAATLCISTRTVETHRAHILKKLGLHNMADLIRFAADNGLLLG